MYISSKKSLPTSISFTTVEYFKRGFQGHRCSKALQGFCKCKCFANPLARRMVRYLKEKDDGGTTGGLSSAGTPHNNFCVHPAVHFRQGGGVEGGRGRQPQPSEKPVRGDLSVGVPHDRFSSARGGERISPLCVPHRRISSPNSMAIQHFCFESKQECHALGSSQSAAPVRKNRFVSRLDRPLALKK